MSNGLWIGFKLGLPVGALGGLIAIGGYIGIKGDEFSIFDLGQWSKMLSLFFGGFVTTITSFLIGLKMTPPWNGKERRNNDAEPPKVL